MLQGLRHCFPQLSRQLTLSLSSWQTHNVTCEKEICISVLSDVGLKNRLLELDCCFISLWVERAELLLRLPVGKRTAVPPRPLRARGQQMVSREPSLPPLPCCLPQRALPGTGWKCEGHAGSVRPAARTPAPPHASRSLHRARFPDLLAQTETGFPESAASPSR